MEKALIQNQNSSLILDLKNGAQIEKLELETEKGKVFSVINKFNPKDFFLGGNFLMFPWVNRILEERFFFQNKEINLSPKKKDSNGLSIHGNFFEMERKIIELKKNELLLEPISYQNNFPKFIESFFLGKNFCEFKIEFHNDSSEEQIFAFGYHPYLSLNQNLDELNFKTNLNLAIALNSSLVPDFETKQENPFLNQTSLKGIKLDNLFSSSEKEIFFAIENESTGLKISFENDIYSFVQIYTPEDRLSIAVEPMSSTGNVFFEKKSCPVKLKPQEKISAKFLLEVYDTNA